MRSKLRAVPGAALVLAVLVLWPLVDGDPYTLNVATGAAIWGLFAVSYDLVMGWTGEISFGHSLWFGLGVYLSAILLIHTSLPPLLVVLLALAIGLPVSLLVHLASLRLRGAYFAMITFAFAEFVNLVVQNETSLTGGTNGLVGIPLGNFLMQPLALYETCAALLFLAVIALLVIARRRTGRIVHAVRDNPARAALLGHSETWVKAWTLVAASLLAMLAGFLYLAFEGMAFPSTFDSSTSFTVLLMATIGGADTIWGPALAGAILYVVESYLSAATSHWALALGLIYILVVRFLPGGMGTIGQQLRRSAGGSHRTRQLESETSVPQQGGPTP